ncbi:MAG TPA: phospholipase D family protein [Steroidobacteraceae bacterium]|nr:phospholipase D family protein [Steroidobacteraceae bacterium]
MRRLIVLMLSGVLGACQALAPVDTPDEFALAPASSSRWDSLAAVRTDDWQVLLDDGPSALDWRLLAIDAASESVDMQTFLWDFDTAVSMVLTHLMAAAERGVRVRLLVDDTFLASEDRLLLALEAHPNIEYRVYNPFRRRADGLVTREILNLGEFGRLDHRMHNKALIADNRVAIVGGRNIADEYFGLHDAANFRDLELLVGGPIVHEISVAFDAYWNDRWSFPIEALSHLEPSYAELGEATRIEEPDIRIHNEPTPDLLQRRWEAQLRNALPGKPTLYVDAPPAERPDAAADRPVQLADELTALLDNATEEILVLSAYLIPSPHLEAAIERAVRRGVEVRILTNSISSNNHLAAHSAYRNHIRQLLSGGAELHEVRVDARDRYVHMFPPADRKSLALHAKALVIDHDKVFIGSANLDPRSLRINTEMGLLVESEALNARVRTAFEPDFAEANAWHLKIDERGEVVWVSEDVVLRSQPADSFMQRIEDWFLAHLPLEDKM